MEYSQLPWPKKGEELFKETGNYHEFSHFGWGDSETQFFGYIAGYKDSADTLIDQAINSKNIQKLDTFVFPICFLYRQYLELAMKDLYLKYSEETVNEKIKIIKSVNHDLMEIWKKIKNILIENSNETEIKDIEIVEEYIMQFHNCDNSSFTFRYPVNKKLQLLFNSEKRLDLVNLKTRIDELYSFF